MGETRNSKSQFNWKVTWEEIIWNTHAQNIIDLRERDGKDVNGSQQAKGIAPLQASVTKFRLHKDRALFNYLGNY